MTTTGEIFLGIYALVYPFSFRLIARDYYYNGWDTSSNPEKLHRFWRAFFTGAFLSLFWPAIGGIFAIGMTGEKIAEIAKQGRNTKFHTGAALLFFGRPPEGDDEEKAVVEEIEPGPGKREDSC